MLRAREIEERKELAKRLLNVVDGDRVIFHGSMVSVYKPDGKSDMVSWRDLPNPHHVVSRVMKEYRRGESYLSSLVSMKSGNGGFGLSREFRLLYVGLVEKVLLDLGPPGEIILKCMHPPNDVSISMGDIVSITGMKLYKIEEVYDDSVRRVAPEMLRKELFIDFANSL